jgi:hypothetical protein
VWSGYDVHGLEKLHRLVKDMAGRDHRHRAQPWGAKECRVKPLTIGLRFLKPRKALGGSALNLDDRAVSEAGNLREASPLFIRCFRCGRSLVRAGKSDVTIFPQRGTDPPSEGRINRTDFYPGKESTLQQESSRPDSAR